MAKVVHDIQHQTVLLSLPATHAPTHHLLQKCLALGGSCQQNAVGYGNVRAFCQYTTIHQHRKSALSELVQQGNAVHSLGPARHGTRIDAMPLKRFY
jgi:hypothetical protein